MKDIDTEKARKSHPIAGKSAESPASGLSVLTTANRILNLQRTIGNRAALHLFQPKLKTSLPSDDHEQEADRAAEQALRITSAPGQMVQRKCADCSPGAKCSACAEEEETIQRKTKGASLLSPSAPHIQREPKGAPVLSSTTTDIQRAPRNADQLTQMLPLSLMLLPPELAR